MSTASYSRGIQGDYEVFSSRLLPYASANLTYNLDNEGHLGLNAQYTKGSDPQLGTLDDKFTIGLTGKL